jgi:hypothetical protein
MLTFLDFRGGALHNLEGGRIGQEAVA